MSILDDITARVDGTDRVLRGVMAAEVRAHEYVVGSTCQCEYCVKCRQYVSHKRMRWKGKRFVPTGQHFPLTHAANQQLISQIRREKNLLREFAARELEGRPVDLDEAIAAEEKREHLEQRFRQLADSNLPYHELLRTLLPEGACGVDAEGKVWLVWSVHPHHDYVLMKHLETGYNEGRWTTVSLRPVDAYLMVVAHEAGQTRSSVGPFEDAM